MPNFLLILTAVNVLLIVVMGIALSAATRSATTCDEGSVGDGVPWSDHESMTKSAIDGEGHVNSFDLVNGSPSHRSVRMDVRGTVVHAHQAASD
jgi:hypothetical protein